MTEKTTPIFLALIWLSTSLCAQTALNSKPANRASASVSSVQFSKKGGFYDHPLLVELIATPGSRIFYTTNGSEPTGSEAMLYRKPVPVTETTVIRAVARRGGKRSPTAAETYFVKEPPSTFPTLSIAVPPYLLFDPENGLFVKGPNVVEDRWSKPGANFWSRVEIPAHFQFFETDGQSVFNSRIGFRLFGGMSRLFPQKSIALAARRRYGEKSIRHEIFGQRGFKKYKYLVLRNSGSDWGKTHFRDALMTSLVDDWDIEKQDYRPSHVYINGKYWGIYNLREKINGHFLQAHRGVDKDSIDMLEHQYTYKSGRRSHYIRMLKYLIDNDLSDPKRYAYIQTQMEVENFMDYQIAQIYFDNHDAGGNIRYWRPQKPNGRWRWILFDTDYGFGLYERDAYKKNSLAFHTEPKGPSWPNPPWSTFILRKLLQNKVFEHAFINRFCDRLNSSFEPERVLAKIDEHYRRLQFEMPRHLQRWRLSRDKWEEEVQVLRDYGVERPAYVRQHLMEKFETGRPVELGLETTEGGAIVVNKNLEVRGEGFSGIYFENIPVHLKAIPNFGYRFSHWAGMSGDEEYPEFTLRLNQKSYHLKAVFERYIHPLAGKIILNEISCNNHSSGDWVEIYNYSKEPVRLRNWVLTDRKNEFRFPDIELPPKDYLVVAEDSVRFFKTFPQAYNVIGGLGFGLNKVSETLGLFTHRGAFIDSVGYRLEPTDSAFTLSLLLPWLDNSDLENWETRPGIGSPNAANPYFVESNIRQRQQLWFEIGGALVIVFVCIILLAYRRQIV